MGDGMGVLFFCQPHARMERVFSPPCRERTLLRAAQAHTCTHSRTSPLRSGPARLSGMSHSLPARAGLEVRGIGVCALDHGQDQAEHVQRQVVDRVDAVRIQVREVGRARPFFGGMERREKGKRS